MGVRGKSGSAEPGGAPNGDPDPHGRGQYNPETGLSEYYDYPDGKAPNSGLRWDDVYKHWNMIEADLQEVYGIDIESGVLGTRTYRWLIVRIAGLMSVERSRLRLTLYPPKKQGRTRH